MHQMRWNFFHRFRRFLRWIWKQEGTPGFRARGLAIGVFCGCFPLFGFQSLLGIALTKVFRGNYLLALTGTLVSNPVTYIPLYFLNYRIGTFFLGNSKSLQSFSQFSGAEIFGNGWTVASRLFFGSFLVGSFISIILGLTLYIFLIKCSQSK